MIRRELGWVVAAIGFVVGCDSPATPGAAAPTPTPAQVLCAEYPAERQDVVSCRYASPAQGREVWVRSTQLAATSAISLGATHIQWLSGDTTLDSVHWDAPIECQRNAWGTTINCTGGPTERVVGFITVTRFALLSAAEAAARSSDPLVPAERRPIDARAVAAATPR